MSNDSHKKRWQTALILLPLLCAAIIIGDWALFGAIALASAIGQLEFYGMFWPGKSRPVHKLFGCVMGIGLVWAAWAGQPYAMLGFVAAAFWFGSLGFLGEYGISHDDSTRFEDAQIITAGLLYLPVLLQLALRFSSIELVLVLLAAFASDVGGYYSGSKFGKHRIWPRVSPKKTWEGSFGGMALCCLICLAIGLPFGVAPWWSWVLLGILLNLASQLGDFFESALKRTLGVKDSGTLLPGHGGILDRLDSILLVIPAYALARLVYAFF